ncbi:MAG TPA: DUF6520 family protein [Puia sp.]|jgi:hypothetical protein|nr:DUF6520 family protein [Puia sp.]
MKKLKLILTASAIVIAVAAAVALRENSQDSTGIQQYYLTGSSYKPTGKFGIDYLCVASRDTCTYTSEAGYFMPRRMGTYTPVR